MSIKHRIASVLVIGILLAFGITVIGGEAEDMKTKAGTVIKEKFTLTAPFKDPKRGPVEFNHKKHLQPKDKSGLGYACKKCHHKREKDKNPRKCSECHKKDADGEKLNFSKAMHENCRDCHKKEDGKENDKAPKKCKVCHIKKEPAGEAK
jgi:hypothetical protein